MSMAAPTDADAEDDGAGALMAIEPGTAFHAADILAGDAWTLLRDDPRAVLVDVRTAEERELFGQPDLSVIAKTPLLIAWQLLPDMRHNPEFLPELQSRRIPRDSPILFLCRSGKRSRDAATALAEAGYGACYSIAGGEGFEGWRPRQDLNLRPTD